MKTRLRSRLSVEMLQTLLAITINGLKVGTPKCESLITAAVYLWESQKKRRKLPRDRAAPTPTASNEAANHHVHAASAAAHAAVQTAENHQEQPLDTNITNLVSKVADEVEVATTKLNLATDSNRFFDEGIYSND